ncbi:MAG TPA: transposase [Ktedonobacterales bacterium]|nr:transposase [Ktedonobacterales bacterium]
MPCNAPIITMLEPFRCLFSAPTWKKMLTLLRGTLLARGPRTVTAALWQTGHQQDPNFSTFHQVLNRARWSPLQASRHLLRLIIETFGQVGGTLDIVIDETLERRWGAKIRKRGHYRDSALSSHARSVSSSGLRWIVLALVVTVPWTRHRWALPFLCLLATTPEVSANLKIRHKTLGLRARQAASLLRRWLPGVPIKLLGDQAYSILELGLHCTHQQITLIAPFRLDAVIHEPTAVRDPHALGRPRVVGPRLPALEQVLRDPQTVWECLILDWYGEGPRTLELCTGTAWWYRFGSTPLPIRWVLTRDPAGKRPVKALFSTDQAQSAEEIVCDFMKRWSLETTFEESRAQLGVETQRQWSDLAIERTTPLLFGLYSLVALFGSALAPDGHPPHRQAAWYQKSAATSRDILALVRRHLWGDFTFPPSRSDPDVVLLSRAMLAQLAHAACS